MTTIRVNLKQSGGVWDAVVEGRLLAIGMDADPMKAALTAARRAGFKDEVLHSFTLDSARINQAVITLKIPGATPSSPDPTTEANPNAMGCFTQGGMR